MENKEDYRKTENLVRESFWNVYRPGCAEHYVLHTLRKDPDFVSELEDGYLSGITGEYATPKGYFAACDNPEDFEKYESSFPFKEKLKLPGQLF